MLTPNKELMVTARQNLKGNWGTAIGTVLIYLIMTCLPNSVPFVGTLVVLAIGGPLAFGMSRFFLSVMRKKDLRVGQLFEGFSYFVNSMVPYSGLFGTQVRS